MVGPSYEVRFPQVTVVLGDLTGEDGNAHAIIAKVMRAIRLDVTAAEAAEFNRQATSQPSYEALLELVHRWVTVIG